MCAASLQNCINIQSRPKVGEWYKINCPNNPLWHGSEVIVTDDYADWGWAYDGKTVIQVSLSEENYDQINFYVSELIPIDTEAEIREKFGDDYL